MEKDPIHLLGNLEGVQETLLIPLYARSLERFQKLPSFHDASAIQIVDSLAFDFKKYNKSRIIMWGCAARTLILDRAVKAYIENNPDCTIINLACGLDDRFSRVDNGILSWYNIDFANVIHLRERLLPKHARVYNIASSLLDFKWMQQIKKNNSVLILAEGILMYLSEQEVKSLFGSIAKHFESCTLLCEFMTKWFIDKQKYNDTFKLISKKAGINTENKKDKKKFIMNARFLWGIDTLEDFTFLCPNYQLLEEFNVTQEMKKYSPFLIKILSFILNPYNNKIGLFKKILF